MSQLKIGAYPPRIEHFGPEAVRLGEALAAARVEVEDAKAEQRRLEFDAGKTASLADQALADRAFAAGKPMPGTPNAGAYKAAVVEAGARLRAALVAETEADEALFLALVDNVDTAADAADLTLDQAADAHRAALDALAASRARLLAAEGARRYVDGVDQAASYAPTDRWDLTFPIGPAGRPAKRNGNYLMPMRVRVEDIDKGLTALRDEIEICCLRPDHGPVVATPGTPDAERQFASSARRRPARPRASRT